MNEPRRLRRSDPFHILVVGDFSGVGVGGIREETRGRRPVRLETVDTLLGRVRPSVPVETPGGGSLRLEFPRLEAFHPDHLLDQLPSLGDRLDSARRHIEASTADSGGGHVPEGSGSGGLLDDIVEDAGGERPASPSETPLRELKSWIRDVVSPHLEPGEAPDEDALREKLERAVADELRTVLRCPPVRTLESVWRSFLFMAAVGGADPDVQMWMLDMSRQELVSGDGDPSATPLHDAVRDPPPGATTRTPFALTVAALEFGPDPEDLLLLNRLAMLAHETGTPLLANARPGGVGTGTPTGDDKPPRTENMPELWRELRSTPAAASVALLTPRFLLRPPYGGRTDPCDRLAFEEVPAGREDPPGDEYLWGHPAFAGGAALARAFSLDGWKLDPSTTAHFEGRPLHVAEDGVVLAHPVERLLGTRDVRTLREVGLTPIIGFREAARMSVPALGPLSSAERSLKAWWK